MGRPEPETPEPRGCTLPDLVLLVAGVGLAIAPRWASLPVAGFWPFSPVDLGSDWLNHAGVAAEGLHRACAALLPVVLFRRWRSGGPIRPAEYLSLFCGVALLFSAVAHWPILGIYPGRIMADEAVLNLEASRRWEIALAAIGVASALLVAVRRRRDWPTGLLLVVAWVALATPGVAQYQFRVGRWIGQLPRWPMPAELAAWALLVDWPVDTLADFPFAVAACGFLRTRLRAWPWPDWAAFGLYASAFALELVLDFALKWAYLSGPIDPLMAWDLAIPPASLAASLAIARLTQPAWRGFLLGEPPAGVAEAGRVRGPAGLPAPPRP